MDNNPHHFPPQLQECINDSNEDQEETFSKKKMSKKKAVPTQDHYILNSKRMQEGASLAHSKFPIRMFLTILLILLTTFQVSLVINSHIYLRGDLVRSFLTIYVDDDVYSQVFTGLNFYLEIANITELQQNLQFMFQQMQIAKEETFLNLDFNQTAIFLEIEYNADFQKAKREVHYRLDPSKGIVEPFNMNNITDIQLFLLEVKLFKVTVKDIVIESEGYMERYLHEVVYHYEEGNEIEVQFDFQIDNTMLNSLSPEKPQFGYSILLRLFYSFHILCAVLSLYFNFIYIRRTFKEFYNALEHNSTRPDSKEHKKFHRNMKKRMSIFEEFPKEEAMQISDNIMKWIEEEEITLNEVKWENYASLIEFHTYFTVLSNVFQIIGSVYLIFGTEHEVIIGMGCLMSWLTVFKFIKKYQNLVLMYEVMKMSIIKISYFLISLVALFLGYSFLGMCLYPKVLYFSSLSKSVTTLVSMMAGDSIRMFSQAICDKYSSTSAMLYIFSYVIMFMHAIHNMLTSILKEYFLMKKVELIRTQKKEKGEEDMKYLAELPTLCDSYERQIPIKVSERFEKELLRAKILLPIEEYTKIMKKLFMLLEEISFQEKWEAFDLAIFSSPHYIQELERRLSLMGIEFVRWGEELEEEWGVAEKRARDKKASMGRVAEESLLSSQLTEENDLD